MSFAPVHTTALRVSSVSESSDASGFMDLADYACRKFGVSGNGLKAGLSPLEKARLIKSGAIISIAPPAPDWLAKSDLVIDEAPKQEMSKDERNAKILQMLTDGKTYVEIAKAVGCSYDTVSMANRRHFGVKRLKTTKQLREELDAFRAQIREGETPFGAATRMKMVGRLSYLRSLELKGKI